MSYNITHPLENLKPTVCIVDEDPREALLKYAAVSEDDPVWVGKGKQLHDGIPDLNIISNPTSILAAYQKTQPQTVFEKDEDDDDDSDDDE